ncbi:MAG: hypothetical protein H5T76_11740 [Streptomyces sp.]|nr:hypothetical protein [Streptomyces sp.]
MTAVAVEITPWPAKAEPVDLVGPVVVEDVEELTVGAVPGCGEDNPYQ